MSVYLKCMVCGGAHSSPTAMRRRRSFDMASFTNNRLRAHRQAKNSAHDSQDVFWQGES